MEQKFGPGEHYRLYSIKGMTVQAVQTRWQRFKSKEAKPWVRSKFFKAQTAIGRKNCPSTIQFFLNFQACPVCMSVYDNLLDRVAGQALDSFNGRWKADFRQSLVQHKSHGYPWRRLTTHNNVTNATTTDFLINTASVLRRPQQPGTAGRGRALPKSSQIYGRVRGTFPKRCTVMLKNCGGRSRGGTGSIRCCRLGQSPPLRTIVMRKSWHTTDTPHTFLTTMIIRQYHQIMSMLPKERKQNKQTKKQKKQKKKTGKREKNESLPLTGLDGVFGQAGLLMLSLSSP